MTDWDSRTYGELSCQEFVELVTEYLEGRLAPELHRRFEQHVADCPGCERYLNQIRDTQLVVGRVVLDSLSVGARDQLLTAFRAWRSERGGDASAP